MINVNTKSNTDEAALAEAQQAVGQLLRETREKAGMDIAEVARVLRISKRYLDALEDGRNEDLPGATYAIGFVRSYAEYLKLDGEEIVRRYKAEAEGVGVKTDLTFPKPIPDSGVPGAAVLGLGVIVAAVAYGVWYWNSSADDMTVVRVEPVPEHMAATPVAPAEEPAAPMVEEAVVEEVVVEEAVTEEAVTEETALATPEPAPEPAPEPEAQAAAPEPAVQEPAPEDTVVEETPVEEPAAEEPAAEEPAPEEPGVQETPAEEPAVEAPAVEAPAAETATATETATTEVAATVASVGDEGPSRITVRAKSNSWIQIRDEALDRLLFTRLLREGDEYEVPNRPGLRLMTGNAGALELLVDGEAITALGEVGEVRRNVDLDPDKLKAGTAVTD